MNGFDIFETPVLSKEHTDMLAKELSKNSPMRDINQHYSEELQVLNEMKAKMEQQKDGASGASNVVSDVVSDVVSQLTETQREIIKLIQANPFMSATQMSQVMSVGPRTIQRQLAALQKTGCYYPRRKYKCKEMDSF